MSFDNLGLIPELLSAVKQSGYTEPTPIQVQAIPPALADKDILGCAQTGTGKTAAFALPLLQRIHKTAERKPKLRALVLTPTRELAAQIHESIETYGKNLRLWHTVVFGGVSTKAQVRELREGVDILVATPGRLIDLMGQRALRLDDIEYFVLDEADRMLDMGFLPDVKRIVNALPKARQTLLFSATMPKEIRALAHGLLREPVSIAVAPESATADLVEQHIYFTNRGDKRKLLVQLLKDPAVKHTLVFSRTKHGANKVVDYLEKAGIRAEAIHGNKSQGARVKALDAFRKGKVSVLIATDIAARGIDVDGVSHVINFDVPNVPETYVHRIGRTARAGASGVAWSFCDAEERPFLRDIERLIGKQIPRIEEHPFPATDPPPAPTDLNGKRSGHHPRPSHGAHQRRRRGPRRNHR